MSIKHYIYFRDIPLLYGRVPKVANSSIKAALCRLIKSKKTEGDRTTSDNYWRTKTQGETLMVSSHRARMCRGTHFCFSFVRNPFDRIISAYNNKIIELKETPAPIKSMGLHHSMSFGLFLEVVASTRDENMDIHLLPQSKILCLDGQLIPNFVGRLETIDEDWKTLQKTLRQENLPDLGILPGKNVRRSPNNQDIQNYFEDSGLVRIITERYGEDIERFYGNKRIEELTQRQ